MSIQPSRRCKLPLRLILPMLAVLVGCESSVETPVAAAVPPPRHLVLVSLDTFRADHLRPEVTPRLAALADESLRFDDFVTVAPSTLASHTSLFTGLYPHRHGVASNGWMVPQELETLAEVLGEAGFRSAGFLGSFALLDRFDIDQGFGLWDQSFDQTVGIDAVDQSQRRADRVVDAALAYVEEQTPRADERLFLFVHLFDTHFPYDPPDTQSPRATPPQLSWSEEEKAKALSIDSEEAEELARRYALEAAFVDQQVGRLVDGLRERGLFDDALLVVTSDHGEALWQHGERWHATEVYETTTRGVFFVRPPGGQSTSPVRGVVGTVDVMPTVLRALSLTVPVGLDGEVIALGSRPSGESEERKRFSQATGSHTETPDDGIAGWPNASFPRSVRQGRWKLIQWPLEGREALFDLKTDPSERKNLFGKGIPPPGADVEALRRALEDWAQSADPLPSHFDRDFELDTRRQLCALGYVECPTED